MENVFSNYIKTLDPVHQQLLDQINELTNELENLKREYNYDTTRETLSKQLYGLRSQKGHEKEIKEVEEELKKLPTKEQLEKQIRELEQKIKQLNDKFLNTPFIMAPQQMSMYPMFRLDNGLWIYKSIDSKGIPSGKYYLYTDSNGVVAEPNFEVVTDENDIPIKLKWIQQNEATYGYKLLFESPLELKSGTIEIPKLKKIERTVEEPVIKKIPVEKTEIELKCSRCGYDLKESLRMIFCRNCGLSLDRALTEHLDKNNKKDNKKEKHGWFR
ncbi:MAG: hypothetical protein ACPLKS_07620 [Caldisericum exile]|uniref:hypothetical protein n=1 Tax=Caldisericum exile TaxID=693075 RepID=UPI003C74FCA1